jgi:hypothetical protein
MAEKTYINGCFLLEHVFQDGGTIIKLRIPSNNVAAFCDQIKAADTGNGANLVIGRLREGRVSPKTGKLYATHNLSVDTYQPKEQAAPAAPAPKAYTAIKPETDEDDSLPF